MREIQHIRTYDNMKILRTLYTIVIINEITRNRRSFIRTCEKGYRGESKGQNREAITREVLSVSSKEKARS